MSICRKSVVVAVAVTAAISINAYAEAGTPMRRLPVANAVYTPINWDGAVLRGQSEHALVSHTSCGCAAGCDGSCDGGCDAGCDSGCDAGCDGACGTCGCDDCCCGSWVDGLSFFFAGDGWKHRADDNNNNNFGFRVGFNSGWQLTDNRLALQVGASYGGYDWHGRDSGNENSTESTLFLTVGAYRRSDVSNDERLSLGVVVDFMNANRFGRESDSADLAQLRGIIGYALDDLNELGLWGTFRMDDDFLNGYGRPVRVMDQVNLYWKHNCDFGADVMAYIGVADDPGEMVLGFNGHAPLSDAFALFGGFHYIIPSTSAGDRNNNAVSDSFAEETWNVTFGLVWYPGWKAVSHDISGNARTPLLNVADFGTFATQTSNN